MKKFRIVLYIIFLAFMGITIYMGLNIDKMISRFGLLSFFRFFQNWLTYGNLYFIVLLVTENFHIWFLKRRVRYAEDERDDLIIRVNDLRKQISELKKENEEKKVSDIIIDQLKEAATVLDAFLNDKNAISKIEQAADLMASAIDKGGKIMTCGNGGSHCDAMHFAEELTGKFRNERRALPAISIADPSHLTCVGNDYGFDHIFSRYVEGLGKAEDVLLGISTSGNSANVINAVNAAKAHGMKVVALTGKSGGKLAELSDVEIRVPHMGYSDRIQEIHIKVIHIIILLIEQKVK